MSDVFRYSPQRAAVMVLDLTRQLDRQLYAQLYALRPLTYAARRKLFTFCFATVWANCSPKLGSGAARVKPVVTEKATAFLSANRAEFFAQDEGFGNFTEHFGAKATQFDLAWQMAMARLDGSQRSQAYAGIRQCLEEILSDSPGDKPDDERLRAIVLSLAEALPKLVAAF